MNQSAGLSRHNCPSTCEDGPAPWGGSRCHPALHGDTVPWPGRRGHPHVLGQVPSPQCPGCPWVCRAWGFGVPPVDAGTSIALRCSVLLAALKLGCEAGAAQAVADSWGRALGCWEPPAWRTGTSAPCRGWQRSPQVKVQGAGYQNPSCAAPHPCSPLLGWASAEASSQAQGKAGRSSHGEGRAQSHLEHQQFFHTGDKISPCVIVPGNSAEQQMQGRQGPS